MIMNERTFDPSMADRLDDPGRLQWLPPDEVIRVIRLVPGSTVADIGAGTGYFAFPFAAVVGEGGRVFAIDFQREMLSHIRRKLSERGGQDIIQPVEGEGAKTGLPTGSCDIVFMANIWHELDDYPAVLREARRVLRRNGRLAIVDWRSDLTPPPGPPASHRVPAVDAQKTLQQEGWSVEDAGTLGTYSHYILASLRSAHDAP